jgi:hypothetical protein
MRPPAQTSQPSAATQRGRVGVLWVVWAGFLFASGVVAGEGEVERHEIDRYEKIWTVSPFVAVTDLSGQVDELSGRFVLTGFARFGEKDVVFLFDRSTLERFMLTADQPRHGIELDQIHHEGDLRTARVSLRSGGRSVELTYDPGAVPDAGMGATASMPQNPMAGGNPNPGASRTQIVGGSPNASPDAPPPPRRVIRRRAITAPQ